MANHQRANALVNAHVGREFELDALRYFREREALALFESFSVPIGVAGNLKDHRFDLGANDPPVLVECKSHTWTETGNMPSAKVTVWNEATYYFLLSPARYRKILFVLEARHPAQRETLAEYYVRTNGHLIPLGVSIMEYHMGMQSARPVIAGQSGRGAREPHFPLPRAAPMLNDGARNGERSIAAQAQFDGYVIRQLDSGTVEIFREGTLQVTAMPLLRDFAARLGLSIKNGQGNPMTTRQLGAAVIRAVSTPSSFRALGR